MRQVVIAFIAALCFVSNSFGQNNLAKIAAENAKQEASKDESQSAFEQKYQVVDITSKRRAVMDRTYVPKKATTYVFFVNTEDAKYLKVIEKYARNNGLKLINYRTLNLENVTDEARIKKQFENNQISGAIQFSIKKDVTEVPNTVQGWGGAGMFWGSGQFSNVGLTIAFFDDDYGTNPYLSLSGHGYTSQPNKGAKIVANEVNALLNNAIKLGFIKP